MISNRSARTRRPLARLIRSLGSLVCLGLIACGGSGGSSSGAPPPPADALVDDIAYGFGPGDSLPAGIASEKKSTVTHQLTYASTGRTVSYTTVTGHLTAADLNGRAEASIFYVAYLAPNADGSPRPLTFIYNGGPGSSSIWLKMGAWSPSRVATPDPATSGWPDFPLVDNQESLIDTTDLVFVDPPGTGLSEAIAPFSNASFWGVDQDAGIMRDFIERYVAVNKRTSSPIYLYGESYGTPRTDVLAPLLEQAGVHLTGLVLHSCVLDLNALYFSSSDVQRADNYIAESFPTYAAISAFYGDVSPAPANLTAYMQQMRDFVAADYNELAPYGPTFSGTAVTPVYPDQQTYSLLSSQTGLDQGALTAYLGGAGTLYDNLVPGSVIGAYDGRVSAARGSPIIANDPDPSDSLVHPFVDIFDSHYLPDILKYAPTQASYVASNGTVIQNWDYSHAGQPIGDTIPDLLEEITLNPQIRILVINGYHDLVTPFFGTEKDLARLKSVTGIHPDIQITHYAGGHMTYLDDRVRPQIKADLASFYAGQTVAGAMVLADLPDPWPTAAPAVSPVR